MATNQNYPKTVTVEKPNGIFLIFNDYEYEEDFPKFLKFLASQLRTPPLKLVEHPYSQSAIVPLATGDVTALFHSDTGCCLLVPLGNQLLADQIIVACYPATNG